MLCLQYTLPAPTNRDTDTTTTMTVLRLAVAAAVSALCAASPQNSAVDTHVHFADLQKFQYLGNWVKTSHFPPEYRSDVGSDPFQSGRQVTDIIFIQASVLDKENVAEVQWVESLSHTAAGSVIKGIVGYSELEKGPAHVARDVAAMRAATSKFRGIRRIFELPTGNQTLCWFDTDAFAGSLNYLGEQGLHFEMLTRSAAQYPCVLSLLRKVHPNVRIMVEHLGGPDMTNTTQTYFAEWKQYVTAVAQRERACVKVSGVPERAVGPHGKWGHYTVAQVQPFIVEAIKAFGSSRSAFGGNWFVVDTFSTYDGWTRTLYDVLKNVGTSSADLQKLYHDTAAAFYRLGDSVSPQ